MNFLQKIERLQKLIELIEKEKTGTPSELSKRLNLSKRQLTNQIGLIKNLGVQIEYSQYMQSYRFASTRKVKVSFSLEVLDDREIEKIYGGISEGILLDITGTKFIKAI